MSFFKALNDEDKHVAWASAIALGKIGGETAMNTLLQAMIDNRPGIRGRVVKALGDIGDEALVPVVLQALERDSQVRLLVNPVVVEAWAVSVLFSRPCFSTQYIYYLVYCLY